MSKPVIIATQNIPMYLEVSAGSDVVERVTEYARQHGQDVYVLCCFGVVANVTLRQPRGSPPDTVVETLTGRFNILSLFGFIHRPSTFRGAGMFLTILAERMGQLIRGSVVGPLVTVEPITLMTMLDANATYVRLPLEDEDEVTFAGEGQQPGALQSQGVTGDGGDGGEGGACGVPLNPNALKAHVLEVSAGSDVVERVNEYARRHGRDVFVLRGNGVIAKVTFRLFGLPLDSVVETLTGRFEILSLTRLPLLTQRGAGMFTVTLKQGQEETIGGDVVGALVAAEPIIVMAMSVADATYGRLPLEDEDEAASAAAAGDGLQPSVLQSRGVTGAGGDGGKGGAGGVPFYNLGGNTRSSM